MRRAARRQFCSPCVCVTLTHVRGSRAASVMMLRNLDRLARAQGGAVYMLNGNHESLNIAGDFRREQCPCELCVFDLSCK